MKELRVCNYWWFIPRTFYRRQREMHKYQRFCDCLCIITSVPGSGCRGHCSPQTYSIHLQRLWTLAKSIWSEEHWVGNGESNNNCIRITKPCSAVWTCFYPFYIVCNWIRIIFLPLKCFTRQGDVFSNANAIPVALCTTPINLETTKHFSVSLFTSSGCNYWITY